MAPGRGSGAELRTMKEIMGKVTTRNRTIVATQLIILMQGPWPAGLPQLEPRRWMVSHTVFSWRVHWCLFEPCVDLDRSAFLLQERRSITVSNFLSSSPCLG